jgi:sulfur relay (sulfurtransferase) DsrC/TusE family protein
MEQRDLELIAANLAHDEELRELWEKHVAYEKILDRYSGKVVLAPTEEMEVKEYKKKKLMGKTRLLELVNKYRRQEG